MTVRVILRLRFSRFSAIMHAKAAKTQAGMKSSGENLEQPIMRRPGFTLVELSAAIAVLAVCAIVFAQLVSMTTALRADERTRKTAVDQMQNVLESLAAQPTEKLVNGDFDKTAAESLIERSLPEGKIVFDTKKIEPNNVVFTVTVSWSNGEKRPRNEVAMFRLLTL
jgi:prepilin-type N-terminal cleavage/methylation domain-containing protein